MVLGAGAMRSAGLKNITAKHLAMASQTISILISIIPYARECLRRHLRAKQAVILVDFDKLKRDCQEHQNEIHAKLVAIMGDRLAVHCKTLQEIDWERTGPSADKPNAYMETLVKETGTLHKVLLKYLAGSALEIVMMQVLSAINSRLAEEFGKIPLRSDEAKHRMLTDASYLRDKFQDLKGLERSPPGAELVHLVQDKMVERPAEPAVTKTRHFSTPSMTAASQRARMSHTRSSSTASLSKADDSTAPAQAQVDSVPEDTEALLPLNNVPLPAVPPPDASLTDVGASVSRASEASTGPLIQTQAEETPLPMSPEGEAPRLPIDDLVKETKSAQVQIPSASLALNSISGTPLPGKAEGQPHGAPPVNVKNRLAGLFAKRPSIPTIDVPSISINNALAKVKLPISGHEALASSISARTSGDGPSSGASTEQNTSRTILPQPAQGDREIAVVDDASPDARMQRLSEDDAAKPGEVDSTNVGDYEASDLPVQVSEDQSQRSDVAVSADVTVGPSEDLDTPATSTSIETESQQMEKPGVLDSEAARSANPGREDTIAGEIVTPSTESRELIQTLLPDAAADTKKAVQAQKDDAVSENDEGDTSGSTVSTFESEARSEGIAENYEARDDLDDID